ncbi:unnamed protein product [Polarella glacialis]|uniref:GRIP domain-containing protein n=1 Tax=Polarella glacialis TaxID=89957 RepID=A0A813G919_POLGL|nr:unnamed protein product [Polarella glacialis]
MAISMPCAPSGSPPRTAEVHQAPEKSVVEVGQPLPTASGELTADTLGPWPAWRNRDRDPIPGIDSDSLSEDASSSDSASSSYLGGSSSRQGGILEPPRGHPRAGLGGGERGEAGTKHGTVIVLELPGGSSSRQEGILEPPRGHPRAGLGGGERGEAGTKHGTVIVFELPGGILEPPRGPPRAAKGASSSGPGWRRERGEAGTKHGTVIVLELPGGASSSRQGGILERAWVGEQGGRQGPSTAQLSSSSCLGGSSSRQGGILERAWVGEKGGRQGPSTAQLSSSSCLGGSSSRQGGILEPSRGHPRAGLGGRERRAAGTKHGTVVVLELSGGILEPPRGHPRAAKGHPRAGLGGGERVEAGTKHGTVIVFELPGGILEPPRGHPRAAKGGILERAWVGEKGGSGSSSSGSSSSGPSSSGHPRAGHPRTGHPRAGILERAILERVILERAILERVILERVILERAILERVILERVILERVILERGIIERGILERVILERGILEQGILERGILERGILERVILQRGILERAILERGILERGILERGILERGSLERAILERAILPQQRVAALSCQVEFWCDYTVSLMEEPHDAAFAELQNCVSHAVKAVLQEELQEMKDLLMCLLQQSSLSEGMKKTQSTASKPATTVGVRSNASQFHFKRVSPTNVAAMAGLSLWNNCRRDTQNGCNVMQMAVESSSEDEHLELAGSLSVAPRAQSDDSLESIRGLPVQRHMSLPSPSIPLYSGRRAFALGTPSSTWQGIGPSATLNQRWAARDRDKLLVFSDVADCAMAEAENKKFMKDPLEEASLSRFGQCMSLTAQILFRCVLPFQGRSGSLSPAIVNLILLGAASWPLAASGDDQTHRHVVWSAFNGALMCLGSVFLVMEFSLTGWYLSHAQGFSLQLSHVMANAVFAVVVFLKLHILSCLDLMIDDFSRQYAEHGDAEKGILQWSLIQATLNQASNRLEGSFLMSFTAIVAGFATLSADFLFGSAEMLDLGHACSGKTSWILQPLMMIISKGLLLIYVLLRAARISDKCDRYSSYLDKGRSYLVREGKGKLKGKKAELIRMNAQWQQSYQNLNAESDLLRQRALESQQLHSEVAQLRRYQEACEDLEVRLREAEQQIEVSGHGSSALQSDHLEALATIQRLTADLESQQENGESQAGQLEVELLERSRECIALRRDRDEQSRRAEELLQRQQDSGQAVEECRGLRSENQELRLEVEASQQEKHSLNSVVERCLQKLEKDGQERPHLVDKRMVTQMLAAYLEQRDNTKAAQEIMAKMADLLGFTASEREQVGLAQRRKTLQEIQEEPAGLEELTDRFVDFLMEESEAG